MAEDEDQAAEESQAVVAEGSNQVDAGDVPANATKTEPKPRFKPNRHERRMAAVLARREAKRKQQERGAR